jgi:hypothetical protein
VIIKDHETGKILFLADDIEDVKVGQKLKIDFDNILGFCFWEILEIEDNTIYVDKPKAKLGGSK